MKYWDEMHSKWGFQDGEATPTGIEHYRTAYILAVNRLAEQLGSVCRVVAYDRLGMHNWCLILYVPAEEIVGMDIEDLVTDSGGKRRPQSEVDPDTAMMDAVDQAQELDIDGFLTCEVSLPESSIQELLSLERKDVEA
jgi:hypothetical protein